MSDEQEKYDEFRRAAALKLLGSVVYRDASSESGLCHRYMPATDDDELDHYIQVATNFADKMFPPSPPADDTPTEVERLRVKNDQLRHDLACEREQYDRLRKTAESHGALKMVELVEENAKLKKTIDDKQHKIWELERKAKRDDDATLRRVFDAVDSFSRGDIGTRSFDEAIERAVKGGE